MAEVEAKFLLRRPEQLDDVVSVLRTHGYRVDRDRTSTHIDHYFDTADWAILRAGWAYRCRSRDEQEKLTLKSLGKGDGSVFVREEIDQVLPEAQEKEQLPEGPVQARLEEIAGSSHRDELFRVESRRTVFFVVAPGEKSARIELDFDETTIDAEKRSHKAPGHLEFSELELELESGDVAALDFMAKLLRDELGLTPALYSKFDRGIQAAGIKIPEALQEPSCSELSGDDPVLLLLFDYMERQLRKLKWQQPRAWEGIHPEGVHQMRVAIRRMRAVARSFRGILGENNFAWFNSELRWLAKQLGHARDADVIAANVRESRDDTTSEYAEYLEEQTVEAYSNLVTVMESDRYANLIEKLERFVADGPSESMLDRFGNLTITECSRQLVERAKTNMCARGDVIQKHSPARQLHKLRIESKRFRYLLDFFSTVQQHRWQEAIAATEKLQDVLGEHQDAITAIERLAVYAGSLPPAADHEGELLSTAQRMQKEYGRALSCRHDFKAAWAEFRKTVS